MKEKTSITLPPEILAKIDRLAGSKVSRSALIERVLRLYFGERVRKKIHARDLERLNAAADRLNSEAEDILTYQAFEETSAGGLGSAISSRFRRVGLKTDIPELRGRRSYPIKKWVACEFFGGHSSSLTAANWRPPLTSPASSIRKFAVRQCNPVPSMVVLERPINALGLF
jgi:Arc/MetJ-type ribon-helix-helix transcriptional regulator